MNPIPDPGRKPNLSKDMTTMETSISDLQGELDVVNEPSKNHFKPVWFFAVIVVVALISSATYFTVTQFTQVEKNRHAIDDKCQLGNEQVMLINEKFEQLNVLVIARLKDRPDGSPNPPDVLAAFEKLRKPIPLKTCSK